MHRQCNGSLDNSAKCSAYRTESHCLTLTGLLLSFYTVSFLLVYRHEVIVLNRLIVI